MEFQTCVTFPEWFAEPQEVNEMKQEEISYDRTGPHDEDPLPNFSITMADHLQKIEAELKAAYENNSILREQMSKLSKFRELDSQSTASNPEPSDSLGSARLCRSSAGKYKHPARLCISVFGMRLSNEHIHDPVQPVPAVGEPSCLRPWVSEELERDVSACNAQLQYDWSYVQDLQAQHDCEYDAESTHLDNLIALSRRQRKACREHVGTQMPSASAHSYPKTAGVDGAVMQARESFNEGSIVITT